jgi:hypothetical protein
MGPSNRWTAGWVALGSRVLHGRKKRAPQASTLYFLNQATISFHASSAASLR